MLLRAVGPPPALGSRPEGSLRAIRFTSAGARGPCIDSIGIELRHSLGAEIKIYAPPADRSRPLSGPTLALGTTLHAPLLTSVRQAFARLQSPLANHLIALGSRERREREIK